MKQVCAGARVLLMTVCLSAAAAQQASLPAQTSTTQPASQPASQLAPKTEEHRDPKAVALAERVMKRIGGKQAWDDTRYIKWTFFGTRTHTWDKQRMRDRIEYTDTNGVQHTLVIDLNSGTGSAWKNDQPVNDPIELSLLMERAMQLWINDSYWLVMPYKLLDPGVHLRHAGDRTLDDGTITEVMELTFADGVGKTPQNKYLVYVDVKTDLVVQWDYYATAQDRAPTFSSRWGQWTQFGNIWLSGDRGTLQGRAMKLTDIAVHDDVPNWMFSASSKPESAKP